jgi:hypothetical protein
VYWVGFVDSGVITSVVQFLISKGTFGFGSELFLVFWFCLLWCVFDGTFDLVLRQVRWISETFGFCYFCKEFRQSVEVLSSLHKTKPKIKMKM